MTEELKLTDMIHAHFKEITPKSSGPMPRRVYEAPDGAIVSKMERFAYFRTHFEEHYKVILEAYKREVKNK